MGEKNRSRENSLDAIIKTPRKTVGSGQIGILFFFFLNIMFSRLAGGITGKTCNFFRLGSF